MTTVFVTFICNLPKYIAPKKDQKKGKKGKKDKKSKKGKNKGKNKKDKKEENKDKLQELQDDSEALVIKTKKPTKFLHIEYFLIPGKYNYKIDIVFWESVAKIYTKDGMKAMKSINKNDSYWISFTMKHKILLEKQEIIELKKKSMNFSISTSKHKIVSNIAKKDAEKTFYFKECDIKSKLLFVEAFEVDPTIDEILQSDVRTKNHYDISVILDDLLKFPYKNELISEIKVIPDIPYQRKILNIIENNSKNINPKCLNSLEEPLKVEELLKFKSGKEGKKHGKKDKKGAKKEKKEKKEKKGKKKNKGGKKKIKLPDTSLILLPGESYLTASKLITYNLKLLNDDILNDYLLIEVQNIFNSEQINELNPFVIKIDKMLNIPIDILKDNGFEWIYFSYEFCDISYHTGARPISEYIYFNDHRIYFIEKTKLNSFVEFINSGNLIIQIHGIKTIKYEKPNEIFGQNKKDKCISNPLHNPDDVYKNSSNEIEGHRVSILLAVTFVKLEDLLKPFWRIAKLEHCSHLKHFYYLKDRREGIRCVTMNTINIENPNLFNESPLTERILLENEVCVKVSTQLFKSVSDVLDKMIQTEISYQRMILIIYNYPYAESLIFNVIFYNCHMVKSSHIPDYLNPEEVTKERAIKSISGFVVTCGEYCCLYLEGCRNWIHDLFRASVRKERKATVRVFYNSRKSYSNRIYSEFIYYSGLYTIVLQFSFQYLINNKSVFIKGQMPEPCRRALQKLNFIVTSQYMKDIPDFFLPTVKELLSLNFEWGVPIHWPY